MAVTIKDIARVAGVSHTTVSRALHQHPAIAPETIARIKQIANELGYLPNTAARGLKTQRTQALGVIVRRIVDPFFAEVLQGIEDVLHAEGYSLFLAASHRDAERESMIMRAMGERRVDGVIICSTQIGREHRRQLSRYQVPFVLINNQADDDENGSYSVLHDDVHGSSEVIRHLLSLGHTRIGYLGNSRGGRTNNDRLRGYSKTLSAAGLPVDQQLIVSAPNGLAEGGAIGAAHFLQSSARPTAIACYNDTMAIGAIQALQQAGLRVPEDCSVTGFDNIEVAAYLNPPLTTFDQPKFELGRQAALMMLRVLAASKKKQAGDIPSPAQDELLMLRGTLCVRSSTCPPKSVSSRQ